MKKIVFVLFLTLNFVVAQERPKVISGTVTDGISPLTNVSVSIKDTDDGTTTNAAGKYALRAAPRDILMFRHVGMEPVEIIVEDVTEILNIQMLPKVEELDEVVVTKRKRPTQKDLAIEFRTNKNIIHSNFGYIDKETTPLNLRTLNGNELNPAAPNLASAIEGKFAGVGSGTWLDSSTGITERGIVARNKPIVFEVDGMVMAGVPELDVSMIERIGVIVGTAAARRYGNDVGGVMIINTKMAKYGLDEDDGTPYDGAKLRNNIFGNDAIAGETLLKSEPRYVQEWHNAGDIEKAMKIYRVQAAKYGNSYFFPLDAYRFFSSRADEAEFANSIIGANWQLFENNPVALKALAYLYQAEDSFEKANAIYKEVLILRPNYAQSYLDLASSYREIGRQKKAASIFTRYDYLAQQGLLTENDTMSFGKMMDREFDNLISLHGKEILSKKEFDNYISDEDFNGTRLVFEWNDGEAEFELQFVNPKGHYFKTEHSLFADPDRIREEKLAGYSCEEFLIDESLPGTWQVNAKYLGNKRLTPSYMKATIYYDYGSAAQRKEIKVFKLGLKNVNQELFKIQNTVSITSN